jgi:hypothetical protein
MKSAMASVSSTQRAGSTGAQGGCHEYKQARRRKIGLVLLGSALALSGHVRERYLEL